MASFDALFSPRSIVVIGASNRPGTVGKAVMDNLTRAKFAGKIYPVNTKPLTYHGLTSYASVSAIDATIDLGVIMIPAPAVLGVVEELGQRGVRSVVIISAGFKETGEAGASLEHEVVRVCNHYGMVLLGPNCIGLANPHAKLNATFAETPPKAGHLALVSQSGALGTAFLDLARAQALGFSKFVTIGNKACLDELELISYLASDAETHAIALYLESLTTHPNWVSVVRRITSGHNAKPVIMLKAAVSESGAEAATSHTGAVAGDATVYRAFARQAGALAVDTIGELMMASLACLRNHGPNRAGTAILTNAGGLGIVATDAASRYGLALATISSNLDHALHEVLPSQARAHNPIDLLGDATDERYARSLSLLAHDHAIGSIVGIVTPQSMTDASAIAQSFINFKAVHPHIPLVVSLAGGSTFDTSRVMLNQAGIAHTTFPEDAVQMMSFVHRAAASRSVKPTLYQPIQADQAAADTGIVSALHRRAHVLLPEEAELVLQAYTIPFARARVAKSAVEAVKMAHATKCAVVLKVVSPDVVHKSDVGGVRLSVSPAQAGTAFADIITAVKHYLPHARIEGVLVQKMVEHGLEVLVGAKRDPVFGPAIIVGLGGIYVEVLHDIAMRLAPVALSAAAEMIHELHATPILHGVRGQVGMDEAALADCIVRVSELMVNHPEILELDLNPIVVSASGKGIEILDARIVV